MAPRSPVKRILAALSAFDVADRPMSRLDAARRLREAAEELEAAQVEAARKAGATWLEIGACYGLTKQGAQQRFRAARKQAEAADAAARSKQAEPADAAARSKKGRARGLISECVVPAVSRVTSASTMRRGRAPLLHLLAVISIGDEADHDHEGLVHLYDNYPSPG